MGAASRDVVSPVLRSSGQRRFTDNCRPGWARFLVATTCWGLAVQDQCGAVADEQLETVDLALATLAEGPFTSRDAAAIDREGVTQEVR